MKVEEAIKLYREGKWSSTAFAQYIHLALPTEYKTEIYHWDYLIETETWNKEEHIQAFIDTLKKERELYANRMEM